MNTNMKDRYCATHYHKFYSCWTNGRTQKVHFASSSMVLKRLWVTLLRNTIAFHCLISPYVCQDALRQPRVHEDILHLTSSNHPIKIRVCQIKDLLILLSVIRRHHPVIWGWLQNTFMKCLESHLIHLIFCKVHDVNFLYASTKICIIQCNVLWVRSSHIRKIVITNWMSTVCMIPQSHNYKWETLEVSKLVVSMREHVGMHQY